MSAHSITGYEIFSRCLKTGAAYISIVRWNGPQGDFTELTHLNGAQYGVKTGDILKVTIIGNVITGYINGVKVTQATDDTYTTGNPGVGFNYGVGNTNADFGFTSFSASSLPIAPLKDTLFEISDIPGLHHFCLMIRNAFSAMIRG